MVLFALLQGIPDPSDCLALGFCPVPAAPVGAPPGLMFAAVGLVIFGVKGLRARGWSVDR